MGQKVFGLGVVILVESLHLPALSPVESQDLVPVEELLALLLALGDHLKREECPGSFLVGVP